MPQEETHAKRKKNEDQAVTNFREYLRIKTVHPDADYDGAIQFLERMAKELELPFKCIEVHPGKPVGIITWNGKNPSLPSLMLNSHMDVVPVFQEHWKCDAFEAKKMDNGDIYGRGTQDMKSVAIQYIEAIRRLKSKGETPQRTIYMTFVPDEEVTGTLGMGLFIKRPEFKEMNVGYVLDEGLANPEDAFTVFYAERPVWWVNVKCTGNPGHGSRFIENTAAEKLQKVIDSFLAFREEQKKRLEKNVDLRLGDVTTVNLTKLQGGIAHNVVPVDFTASFDIRLSIDVDMKVIGINRLGYSRVGDTNMKIETEVFPAATDSRFLRAVGYSAIGFSPMNKTPILLHDHNEFLNEEIFLKGITIYEKIIPALANVPAI
ncbi:aminoacylase-1-like [Saccoglossus kowalevskii]